MPISKEHNSKTMHKLVEDSNLISAEKSEDSALEPSLDNIGTFITPSNTNDDLSGSNSSESSSDEDRSDKITTSNTMPSLNNDSAGFLESPPT